MFPQENQIFPCDICIRLFQSLFGLETLSMQGHHSKLFISQHEYPKYFLKYLFCSIESFLKFSKFDCKRKNQQNFEFHKNSNVGKKKC
jgi:hypothetical protein